MSREVHRALLCMTALFLLGLVGCNKSADTASTGTTGGTTAADQSAPKKAAEKGGSAADTKAYPAPAGATTGNYQGGKK